MSQAATFDASHRVKGDSMKQCQHAHNNLLDQLCYCVLSFLHSLASWQKAFRHMIEYISQTLTPDYTCSSVSTCTGPWA